LVLGGSKALVGVHHAVGQASDDVHLHLVEEHQAKDVMQDCECEVADEAGDEHIAQILSVFSQGVAHGRGPVDGADGPEGHPDQHLHHAAQVDAVDEQQKQCHLLETVSDGRQKTAGRTLAGAAVLGLCWDTAAAYGQPVLKPPSKKKLNHVVFKE